MRFNYIGICSLRNQLAGTILIFPGSPDSSIRFSPYRIPAVRDFLFLWFSLLSVRFFSSDVSVRKQIEAEREQLISDLQSAIEQITTLKGIVPVCANGKKIRDDKGYWEQVDQNVAKHTDVKFSHGICPDYTKNLYPDYYNRMNKEKNGP